MLVSIACDPHSPLLAFVTARVPIHFTSTSSSTAHLHVLRRCRRHQHRHVTVPPHPPPPRMKLPSHKGATHRSVGQTPNFPTELNSRTPLETPSEPPPPPPPTPPPPDNLLRNVGIAIFAVFGTSVGLFLALGGNAGDIFRDITTYFDSLDPTRAAYLYGLLYFSLELVAIPALPLTLGAGYLFGIAKGTAVVSVGSTLAAATAFLISRYFLKQPFLNLAVTRYPKFKSIDKAIAKQGLKVIFLLRLSPLLPFSISNYLYGLSSVPFWQFAAASWAGMLPGTFAYVSAGAAVVAVSDLAGAGALDETTKPLLVGIGVVATILGLGLIGNIAQKAIKEVQDDEEDGDVKA